MNLDVVRNWVALTVGGITLCGLVWAGFSAVQAISDAPAMLNETESHVQQHHHGDSVAASPQDVQRLEADVHVVRHVLDSILQSVEVESARRRERNQRRDFLLCQALGIPPSECNP